MTIKTMVHCRTCKNFVSYGNVYDGGEEVTSCELGRYHEHREAENNNWLTECEFWESKRL